MSRLLLIGLVVTCLSGCGGVVRMAAKAVTKSAARTATTTATRTATSTAIRSGTRTATTSAIRTTTSGFAKTATTSTGKKLAETAASKPAKTPWWIDKGTDVAGNLALDALKGGSDDRNRARPALPTSSTRFRTALPVPIPTASTWAGRYHGRDYPLIASITPGGPASRAGLRIGDVLVQYNGVDLGNTSAQNPLLERAKQSARSQGNASVEVVFRRSGSLLSTRIPPGNLGVGYRTAR